MTSRPTRKAKHTPASSPPLSVSAPSIAPYDPTNAQKTKSRKAVEHAMDEVQADTSKDEHFGRALFVKLTCAALAFAFVTLSPRANGSDYLKNTNESFLSLYMRGELKGVTYITQMLVAAFFSVFLDIGVVSFHVTTPPHPKFVMLPSRKLSIYTHLVSGIVEIVGGVLAFTVGNVEIQRLCAIAVSLAAITHCITAYYQTGIVFGAKGVMVPGYLYAITLHAVNAYQLFCNPVSLVSLLQTYLMLHIYVWCRFFIYIFRACKMFTGYHYTVAITLSGLLLFPYAVGPVGNFGMLFICLIYGVLEFLVSDKKGDDLIKKLFVEHERYSLISQDSAKTWKSTLHSTNGYDDDRKMAQEAFDKIDIDKNGKLDVSEIHNMLAALNLPAVTVSKILQQADPDHSNDISFEEFYLYIWNIGSIHQRLHKMPKTEARQLTDKEKAKIVFEMLDIDGSKSIGLAELDMLLSQWGMPHKEAYNYLQLKMKGEEQIPFEVFYKELKPIWLFATTYIFN